MAAAPRLAVPVAARQPHGGAAILDNLHPNASVALPESLPDIRSFSSPFSILSGQGCSCGNQFSIRSTLGKDLNLDICSKCHPFYTGKQKMVDTAGRVDAFRKRYAKS